MWRYDLTNRMVQSLATMRATPALERRALSSLGASSRTSNGTVTRAGRFGPSSRVHHARSPLRARAGDRDRVPDGDKNSRYYSESAAGPAELDSLLELYLSKCRSNAAADAARAALERPSADDVASPSSIPRRGPNAGKVYLIGTGPGDPGLLTLKAYHLMQTADVVLYDRLVSPQILDLVSTDSTMLYVGKQSGYHTRTQDEIEAMMLAFAANGATIVRLKGGDPLVFGRGGEEMEALAARGHEVRIVPGITAAAGVGSELGIPLTHRGVATSVRLLTGHLREGAAKEAASGDGNAVADAVDFAVTSADLDTTLVVYMGLATLPALAAKLLASGFPADTPAVAVERGTTHHERRVFSTIEDLPESVATCGLKSPTLLIVGATVKLSPWWPWRDQAGDAIAPTTSPAYDLQTGLPSEDTREWFTEHSRTLGKLREIGDGVRQTRGEEPAEEGDPSPAR